jgi:mannosyltransferase OCH1-like enzyme
MNDFKMQMVNSINDDINWILLEKLYNNHYNRVERTEKIPKIIHQIWLGGEFPSKYNDFRDKMMSINNNWEYKLWTDVDVDTFDLKNKILYNNIKNLGAKSDIFRYEILERIGGLYIDVDFDTIKPFDDLCSLDFFAGVGHVDKPEVFNSLMASIPKHKYIASLVSDLQTKTHIDDSIGGVMENTGPYFITRKFFEVISEEDNVVVFPTKYFFPFPAIYRHDVMKIDDKERANKFVYSYNNDKTYAIHLWHTNWQK